MSSLAQSLESLPDELILVMSKHSFACTRESLDLLSSKMVEELDQYYRLPIPSYDDASTPETHGSLTCFPASCYNPDSVPSSTLIDTSSTATDYGTEPTISSSASDSLTSINITNNTNNNDTYKADYNSNYFDNNTSISNSLNDD